MFEKSLSVAIASVFLANSQGMMDISKQTDANNLTTPRFEVKVILNGIQPPGGRIHYWINPADNSKWVDCRTGQMILKIVTRRDSGQDHDGLVGLARYVCEQKRQNVSDAMAFHSLAHIEETGALPDFKQDEYHDISSLQHNITLRIMFPEKSAQIFIS